MSWSIISPIAPIKPQTQICVFARRATSVPKITGCSFLLWNSNAISTRKILIRQYVRDITELKKRKPPEKMSNVFVTVENGDLNIITAAAMAVKNQLINGIMLQLKPSRENTKRIIYHRGGWPS